MNRLGAVLLGVMVVVSACAWEPGDATQRSSPRVTTDIGAASASTIDGQPAAPARTGDGPIVYVSPNGDDSAPGTRDEPVASLERGLEILDGSGSILLVAGIHSGGHHMNDLTGITITGEPGAVLDGGDSAPLGLFCDGCTRVTIMNLEVRGFTDIGVGATRSHDITLAGLSIHDNGKAVQFIDWELEGYGIHVDDSTDVTISGNDVYGNGPLPSVPDRILGTGIDTFGNAGVVISGNSTHHNRGGGILVEDSVDVIVTSNDVYANDLDATAEEWWDGGLWIDGGADVIVEGNTFRDNLGPGIEVSDEEGQSPTGYVIRDNVSTGNYFGIFIWNLGSDPDPSVLLLEANDFSGNSRLDIWIEPEF